MRVSLPISSRRPERAAMRGADDDGTTSRNALEISDQLALLGAQFGRLFEP